MTKRSATLIILLGGTCMSFIGLLIRLVDNADGFQILMYRSISLSVMVAIVACFNRKVGVLHFLSSLNKNDIYMGAALAIAFMFYILSMINTSVASTLMILTIVPCITALLAWALLNEVPTRLTLICMVGAIIGVGLMVKDGVELGRTTGNIYALISAVCFAVMLIFARKSKQIDPLGGTFLAGVFSVILGFFCSYTLGDGVTVSIYDLKVILFMGAFAIGLGIALMTWGTAYIPAAEASLLLLIESLLGPVWVWVFLKEAMTPVEIMGGALVLVSVAALALSQKKAPISA